MGEIRGGVRDRAVALLTAAALAAGTAVALPASAATSRVSGDGRVETAVAISRADFGASDTYSVWVASADDYPDALAAGALAAQDGAPLLLVPSDGVLPPVVAEEIRRFENLVSIYIIGGERAVSGVMESQLSDIASSLRLDGEDRYQTAADAAWVAGESGRTVYLASGTSFADALAGGAVAGRVGGSLMLTEPGRLPAATAEGLRWTEPSKVVVLGGERSVSGAVVDQVRAAVPGVPVERVAGGTRYDTAALAIRGAYPSTATTVLLVSGNDYPDGLAGAAVSGPSNRPLLLSDRDCVPAATLAEISRLGATDVVVLGGPAAVSDRAAALTPC